jgi:endonuclease/exonuclease/phosphatase family metal-dependent hydrolase
MALVAQVAIGPTRLLAYNLHLESRDGNDLRNRQLGELFDDAGRHRGLPMVVAGDFNFDLTHIPQSEAISRAGFQNPFARGELQPTLSSSGGNQRAIDCILTSREFQTLTAEVHSSVHASDHYPLSLTVILEGEP